MPPFQPWTVTTVSPFAKSPSFFPSLIPHLRRRSTSSCQTAISKSGFFSGKKKGYTPRYRWEYWKIERVREGTRNGPTKGGGAYAGNTSIASDHEDRANRAILRD